MQAPVRTTPRWPHSLLGALAAQCEPRDLAAANTTAVVTKVRTSSKRVSKWPKRRCGEGIKLVLPLVRFLYPCIIPLVGPTLPSVKKHRGMMEIDQSVARGPATAIDSVQSSLGHRHSTCPIAMYILVSRLYIPGSHLAHLDHQAKGKSSCVPLGSGLGDLHRFAHLEVTTPGPKTSLTWVPRMVERHGSACVTQS